MSTPLRKKRGNTIIWILMAMLILGLGGFGAQNFGGGRQSIGTVGSRDIDMRDYARALNREMARMSQQIGQPVSFAQAQTLGLDQTVQATVIAATALDNEADRFGISVGDGTVRDRLMAVESFQGLDGKFDRDSYGLVLQREGMSEREFEGKIRDDAARALMQGATSGATGAPDVYVDTITAWLTEKRSFALAELIAADLPEPIEAPDAAALKTYYDAHPEEFTKPEARRITYVWLSPDKVSETVQLDEEALRRAYQERIGEYVTPEKRLVERLVYPDEASAAAAKARFDRGEADFAALAEERGLTLADADMGEMSKAELGAAGDAVFALTEPGVVGPIASDLGPALYAMNGILQAQEVSFEDARGDLATEAALDKARRQIADQSNAIEDLMASGATLEDVAKESGMELGTIAYAADTRDGIAAYTAFREAAAAATADDFPALGQLDDGGVFALRLDGIDPPALRPLDEVGEEVAAAWLKAETHDRLVALGKTVAERVNGGEDLEATGLVVTRYEDFARNGFIDGASPAVVSQAFTLEPGKAAVVDADGKVAVVALATVTPGDPVGEDVARIREQIRAQVAQSIAEDGFELYIHAIEADAGISLDQAAVNAVHSQMN